VNHRADPVREQLVEIVFGRVLERLQCILREPQIGLKVLPDLADEAPKRTPGDEGLGILDQPAVSGAPNLVVVASLLARRAGRRGTAHRLGPVVVIVVIVVVNILLLGALLVVPVEVDLLVRIVIVLFIVLFVRVFVVDFGGLGFGNGRVILGLGGYLLLGLGLFFGLGVGSLVIRVGFAVPRAGLQSCPVKRAGELSFPRSEVRSASASAGSGFTRILLFFGIYSK
jgi:hypothetical protein